MGYPKKNVLVSVMMAAVLISTPVSAADLVSDLIAAHRADKSGMGDLTPVVQKHFMPGMQRQAAEDYLKQQRFKLFGPEPDSHGTTQSLVAVHQRWTWTRLAGVEQEIRLIIVFEGDTVKTSKGTYIYRGW